MMKLRMTGRKWYLWRRKLTNMALVGMVLVTLACEEESEPGEYRNVNREIALSDFENALKEGANSIKVLVESRPQLFYPDKEFTMVDKYRDQQLQKVLEPAITRSTKLLETYGISKSIIKQELGNPNDPRLALIGLWVAELERRNLDARQVNRAQLANLSFFFQENTLVEKEPDWMECMMIAVGVDAIIEFVKGNVTEAIAKKAIRKIASRTLGWVGVALALYEYGNCMEWY
jgi:hypothetical protein